MNLYFLNQNTSPQHEPNGYFYTYYTFSARFDGGEHGISWEEFRKIYGVWWDGIYAASKLLFQEPIFKN